MFGAANNVFVGRSDAVASAVAVREEHSVFE